jgi:hypothetical protein
LSSWIAAEHSPEIAQVRRYMTGLNEANTVQVAESGSREDGAERGREFGPDPAVHIRVVIFPHHPERQPRLIVVLSNLELEAGRL